MRNPALGFLGCVLLVVAVVAAKTWLTATIGASTFYVAVATTTAAAMGCATYLSFRFHRELDEVHKAGAEFAARWSMPVAQTMFVLLLFLPPFRDVMTSLAIEFGGPGPGLTVDRSVVVFAMALGYMGIVMLQSLATIVLNAIWWNSKQ